MSPAQIFKKNHKQIFDQTIWIVLHSNDKLAVKVNYIYMFKFNLHAISFYNSKLFRKTYVIVENVCENINKEFDVLWQK